MTMAVTVQPPSSAQWTMSWGCEGGVPCTHSNLAIVKQSCFLWGLSALFPLSVFWNLPLSAVTPLPANSSSLYWTYLLQRTCRKQLGHLGKTDWMVKGVWTWQGRAAPSVIGINIGKETYLSGLLSDIRSLSWKVLGLGRNSSEISARDLCVVGGSGLLIRKAKG